MKIVPAILPLLLLAAGCKNGSENAPSRIQVSAAYDTSDKTNNFYDNTEAHFLAVPEITVDGEVANPGKVDLSALTTHSVFVKETLLDSTGSDKFVGAFRYDGYSLFDILDKAVLKKANSKEFNPIIDLYVEVRNARGDMAVFSWGEIYYPVNLNRVIIANAVSRIVPSKTRDLWPLPQESKIVSGNDLITERNISNPERITVRSFPRSFAVTKGLTPMFQKYFEIYEGSRMVAEIAPDIRNAVTYNTVFYGRGKGIHSTSPFKGDLLKDLLQKYYPVTKENLRTGILCLAAKDGYRCTLAYSELFNRNDQQEFLLIRTKAGEDGGLYRVFPSADFFSDRAVRSLSGIYLIK